MGSTAVTRLRRGSGASPLISAPLIYRIPARPRSPHTMLYSTKDLEKAFDPDVLGESRQLLERGGVGRPNVARGGALLTALIPTIDAPPRRVYIRIETKGDQGVSIKAECTCSRRRMCHHAAAVLLKVLEDDRPAHLAENPGTAPNSPGQGASTGRSLVYVLQAPGDRQQGIRLRFHVAQVLDNGGYGDTRRFIPASLSFSAPPGFLLADDLVLMQQLKERCSNDRDSLDLRDGSLLQRILATGRCYLETPAGPALRLKEGVAARLEWRIDGQGMQHARWVWQPAAGRMLLLDVPWYLDDQRGECGPLVTGLSPALALSLVGTPLAPEDVAALRRRLEAEAGPDFPLPKPLEVAEHDAVEPVPHLSFERHERRWQDGGEAQTIDLLCLDFSYAGRRLVRADETAWLEGETVVRCRRDRAREAACLETLLAIGLTRDEQWSRRLGRDCLLPGSGRQDWRPFQQESLPALLRQGWQVSYAEGFRQRVAQLLDWRQTLEREAEDGWFSLGIGIQTEEGEVDLLPALVAFIQSDDPGGSLDAGRPIWLPLPDGRWLSLPAARLKPILQTLFELYEPKSLDDRGRMRLGRAQLLRLSDLDPPGDGADFSGDAAAPFTRLRSCLRGTTGLPCHEPPAAFQGSLRNYQRQGLDWLQFLAANDLAGILADDMGLGKTVQCLAHLLLEKERGRLDRPALVVAPTSLMTNWRREAKRYAPSLSVLLLHGPVRRERFDEIPHHDLVLTTYRLLSRDRDSLRRHRYHLLILDEAQVIKNPRTQVGRAVRTLPARHRLCLSGTPMENHLGELWSLFDFLLPGLLGNERQFRRLFRNPIEKQGDQATAKLLARRARPFMLRRTKAEVAAELPPRTEIVRSVLLEGAQRELYESIRLATHEKVRKAVADKGIAGSQITILDSLLKLRQVCCDPRLVRLEQAKGVHESAKLALLMDLLPELLEEGRRILLFSQFTGMLEVIGQALEARGLAYLELTGDTRDRATPVARFQTGEVPLFLISLKAGGVGLNLTAADTVIHYDPWWNPAAELQATDRAHRIGQTRPVFVYKLITEGTVEARIQAMQADKQALADRLYGQRVEIPPRWSDDELDGLFRPLDDVPRAAR